MELRFGPKVGQMGSEGDKSETFSDQISPSQIVLKSDLKKSRICLIWDQSEPLVPISGTPAELVLGKYVKS